MDNQKFEIGDKVYYLNEPAIITDKQYCNVFHRYDYTVERIKEGVSLPVLDRNVNPNTIKARKQ